jgi:hypothetical protein
MTGELFVTNWSSACKCEVRVAFPDHSVSGEEGGPFEDDPNRSHLPLRVKLGWITPWSGSPRPAQ